MRAAMIFSYVLIGILAVVVIWQQITISKLVPKTTGNGNGNTTDNNTNPGTSSGRFADIIRGVQDQMQPKEINVKY